MKHYNGHFNAFLLSKELMDIPGMRFVETYADGHEAIVTRARMFLNDTALDIEVPDGVSEKEVDAVVSRHNPGASTKHQLIDRARADSVVATRGTNVNGVAMAKLPLLIMRLAYEAGIVDETGRIT